MVSRYPLRRAGGARRLALCAALLAAGCAQLPPPEPRPEPDPGGEPAVVPLRDPLPPDLATLREQGLQLRGPRVEFVGELDLPPRLKDMPATAGPVPTIVPSGRPSVREARQAQRALAVASPRVRSALGERYSLLASGWAEPQKDAAPDAPRDRYQLTFYNYARNEVVTVTTAQRDVVDVQAAPARVQPPESREEVDAAVAIVRRDERYARLVGNLRGRGIQTPSPKGERDPDRYLYLIFYREPRTPAVFEATVNMSAGRVESAQPLR
jgi:hypothetical protein